MFKTSDISYHDNNRVKQILISQSSPKKNNLEVKYILTFFVQNKTFVRLTTKYQL